MEKVNTYICQSSSKYLHYEYDSQIPAFPKIHPWFYKQLRDIIRDVKNKEEKIKWMMNINIYVND